MICTFLLKLLPVQLESLHPFLLHLTSFHILKSQVTDLTKGSSALSADAVPICIAVTVSNWEVELYVVNTDKREVIHTGKRPSVVLQNLRTQLYRISGLEITVVYVSLSIFI